LIRAALAALALLASPVWATVDGWPALYDVVGVNSDDVLNVRAGPDASAEVIGTLEFNATRIEVIRPDDDFEWGKVNTGERAGWASLQYLVPQPGQWSGQFPPIRKCFGTEPFWAMHILGDEIRFETPVNTANGRIHEQWTSLSRRDSHALSIRLDKMSDHGADMIGFLSQEFCSDGMSDREYGIQIEMLFRGSIDRELLSGCCSISPPAE
jgi:uncharacterized membrane protein